MYYPNANKPGPDTLVRSLPRSRQTAVTRSGAVRLRCSPHPPRCAPRVHPQHQGHTVTRWPRSRRPSGQWRSHTPPSGQWRSHDVFGRQHARSTPHTTCSDDSTPAPRLTQQPLTRSCCCSCIAAAHGASHAGGSPRSRLASHTAGSHVASHVAGLHVAGSRVAPARRWTARRWIARRWTARRWIATSLDRTSLDRTSLDRTSLDRTSLDRTLICHQERGSKGILKASKVTLRASGASGKLPEVQTMWTRAPAEGRRHCAKKKWRECAAHDCL